MGSRTSRQSQMEDRDQSVIELDDDDMTTYTLAQFINSAHFQYLSNIDSMDSEDSDDDVNRDRAKKSKPLGSFVPETNILDNSEFRQEMLLRQSCFRRLKSCSVPSALSQRELGSLTQKCFSAGDKCYLSQNYIPNHMKRINLHRVKAFCGVFSSDGNTFMSATQDHVIRLYDTTRGQTKVIKSIYAHDVGWSVLDTAFSPNGSNIAYCSWSKFIHVYDLTNQNLHHALPLYPEQNSFCIFSLTYGSDGQEILSGASDGCIYIYDLYANVRSMKIDAHDDDISAVVFADNTSQLMYSGGDDAVLKVWDRRCLHEENPVPVGVLAGHTDGITFIDSKDDGRYLISNSKDQSIKLWDIRAFSGKRAIEACMRAVSSQNWDYRWQPVPKALRRENRCEGDTSLMTYRGHCVLHTLIRARFSPVFTTGQNFIYCGCASGDIIVYNVLTGKIVSRLKGHGHCVRDVSWHPFCNLIVSSSWDGSLGIWQYQKGDNHVESAVDSISGCGFRRSERLRNRWQSLFRI